MEQNSDNDYKNAQKILDEKFGKKSERQIVSKKQKKSYNTTPERIDGVATPTQSAKELSYIFTHILRAYGVKHQLSNYIWKMYLVGSDGEEFEINDIELGKRFFGGATRNYMAAMRRRLKEWINGEYSDGRKHYAFITYKDNVYDRKIEDWISTKYTVSPEFIDFVHQVWEKTKTLPQYNYDWYYAVDLALKSFGKTQLSKFGKIWERPERTTRSPEKIVGTLLLHFKNIIAKLFEENRQLGFDVDKTKDVLLQLLPKFIEQSAQEATLKNSTEIIKPSEKDVIEFFNQVIDYVNFRESEKREQKTVIPTPYISSLGGKNKNVRSIRQSNSFDAKRSNESDSGAVLDSMLEHRETAKFSEREQTKTTLDSEKLKFLERHKKRE